MAKVRGAGLRHGWVRTKGTAPGNYFDIDAIVNLEGSLEIDETTVEGDDEVLANFASKPTKSLSMTANSLSMELIAALMGKTVTAIAGTAGVGVGQEVGLGGASEMNPIFCEVGGYTVGKLKGTDENATIERIFHRVQLRITNMTQAKDGEFNVEFEGTAYPTKTDVQGTALAYERIDTLRYTNSDIDSLITTQAAG